jgi:hypothetical protein
MSTPRPAPLHFRLLDAPDQPVIGPDHPDLAGNRFGFEGGRVLKLGGVYHLFTAEMAGEPFWVKMRLAYWTSADAVQWRRVRTLYETPGTLGPADNRFSLWTPIPVFNDAEDRWNLFYVAYRPGFGDREGLHMNGQIWRAISTAAGRAGIGGPYIDREIVLRPDANSQPWEGQQGTASFFPFVAGHRWLAFYCSHQHWPPGDWPVGLAEAPTLAGPWTRRATGNPVPIEPMFLENPVITKIGDRLVAVYDNCAAGATYMADARHIGITESIDGVNWSPGRALAVQPETGAAQWSEDIRTPLGLVAEDDGTFTVLYTGRLRGKNFWPLGLARLRIVM